MLFVYQDIFMLVNSRKLWVPLTLGALLLGIALGATWRPHAKENTAPSTAELNPNEPKVLYWYDPMVPDQHFDKPGKSPFMDMDLVAKYADPTEGKPGVAVAPAMIQNLGMRKAKVERLPLQRQFRISGQLQVNERHQAVIQLRAAGYVEKAWPLAVGDKLVAGQAIAEIQFPAWLDAQNDLLSQPVKPNASLLATLRARLELLGMPQSLIAQVEKSRQPQTHLIIRSPIDGVLDKLEVKNGMALASGATLAQISNLDSLWLVADIPEAQAVGLTPGDGATFYPVNPDDPVLTGALEYLLPEIDKTTRTLKARVLFENTKGQLKPGTSGSVLLRTVGDKSGLFVPSESIIYSGQQYWVMLAQEDGSFRPVAVTTGIEIGDKTQIQQGLDEGDEVVASGQFLLDSEASFLELDQSFEGLSTEEHGFEGHSHD